MDKSKRICFCKGVSYGEIVNAIHQKNARTIEDIQVRTAASTGCGRCKRKVEQILTEEIEKLEDQNNK